MEAGSAIAAISTPRATGGISVIRISGDDALPIASRVFKPANHIMVTGMATHTACYGNIYHDGTRIDDGILTYFRAPKSYTGEDVVEISCHGGLYVTDRTLRACIDAGARAARAGEFTKRALMNGKMTLTEAESVPDIIYAENRRYLAASRSQREGALYIKIEAVSETVLGIITEIAAWVDYPDEYGEDFILSSKLEELNECRLKLYKLIQSFEIGRIMREGVLTAIVGKPNAGKSTLMNLLSGINRSIVTDIPGTTRDIIEESVNIGDIVLRLSDCAGLRETGDIAEAIGVKRMYDRIEEADLIIAVFDGSKPLEEEDRLLIGRIKDKQVLPIINKTDIESKIDKISLEKEFSELLYISANNLNSLDTVIAKIKNILSKNRPDIDMNSGFIANLRQRECAVLAEKALSRAIEGIENGVTPDAVGVMLENTLEFLYELSGKKVSEEVINEVFSRFCVGK